MRGARFVGASFIAMLTACGGGGGSNVNPTNQAPIANAGADQTAVGGGTVTLNGTGSSDPDGTVASYAWSQTAGPTVALTGANGANPVFCAPAVSGDTLLTFSLVVTDNRGLASAAQDTVSITITPNPGGNVTINGAVAFERIPLYQHPPGALPAGWNYFASQEVPARHITVQAMCATQQVIASATTDETGAYALVVPANIQLAIRASSEMVSATPQWQFRVIDDDNAGQLYSFTGGVFDTGTPGGAQNLLITSGWSQMGTSSGTRAAAPFAILDTVYKAVLAVQSVEPPVNFPALNLDWGPNNEGGRTFYQGGPGTPTIVLSGEANVDTDEYDEHVIAHEFGHYLEDHFSRSDSIGGPHGAGDRLDPRVAFGEGFGYAFAGIVLSDSVARDSFGVNQAQAGAFDMEGNAWTNGGWFSEASNWSILWDLFDSPNDGADSLALGFAPLWEVLTNEQRGAEAVTSIFPFIAALKSSRSPLERTQIDDIVNAQSIESPTIEPFAGTENNNAGSGDVLPIYTEISVGESKSVLSVATFGTENKLSNRRFLRFQAPTSQTISVNVTGPANQDIDALVFRRGEIVASGTTPTNVETFTFEATAGNIYVMEVYDCVNAGCNEGYAPTPTDIVVTVN